MRAARAAARSGVTRIADLTGLDRLGVPVHQAVRPWSRALSVHQGKGETPLAASLGALMEAVESDCAETVPRPSSRGAFRELAPGERAESFGDFAADRRRVPPEDEAIDWIPAERVSDGGTLWLPFDVVSLDLSRVGDLRLDRSSTGLACRFDPAQAAFTALLEVVERDALAMFLALARWERAMQRLEVCACGWSWLPAMRERLQAAGVAMRLYRARAVVALPVIVCELTETAAEELPRRHVLGSACHPDVGVAAHKAVLEAIQSRLTAISAVRDDILPGAYAPTHPQGGLLALPAPAHRRGGAAEPERRVAGDVSTAEAVSQLLCAAGYTQAAVVELTPPDGEVAVVKAFVPGLASGGRRRRSPGHAEP